MHLINVLFFGLLGSIAIISAMGLAIVRLKEKLAQERTDAAMIANELSKQKRMAELPRQFNWNKGEEPEMDLTA